jgi:hypothetical protein
MTPCPRLALISLVAACVASSYGQLFDLKKDFSPTANPHNSWSYGCSTTLSGFDPYSNSADVAKHYAASGSTDLTGWSKLNGLLPCVAINQGKSICYQTWGPGDVVLQPGSSTYSMVRWVNPLDRPAMAQVSASFRRVEGVTSFVSDWYVMVNGKIVESGSLSRLNEQASFSGCYPLGRGDSVTFAVGSQSNPNGTGLCLDACISASP